MRPVDAVLGLLGLVILATLAALMVALVAFAVAVTTLEIFLAMFIAGGATSTLVLRFRDLVGVLTEATP